MNPTAIDRLLLIRIREAGLNDRAEFRSHLAAYLAQKLRLVEELEQISNEEIYRVCVTEPAVKRAEKLKVEAAP